MENLQLLIGEHTILIQTNSQMVLQFYKKLYQIDPEPRTPDILIKVEEGFGVPFVDYNVDIIESGTQLIFRRADYEIKINNDYTEASIAVYDDFALKHAMINLYSSYIVHHGWGVLIHSSCIIDQDKAHLFAGHSGAGKSTVAMLSSPRVLLSDEATLLKITENEVLVYDSPFRSDVEEKDLVRPHQLSSIQLLHQALQNDRVLIKKSDGLFLLMDKVFYWSHHPIETKKIFHLLKTLVDIVPMYELHFQKNNTFWELIS